MDYNQYGLDRDEIRALNRLRVGGDVDCLVAAEMDAVMTDRGERKVIEIKSSRVLKRKRGRGRKSKMDGIWDWKLLKFWTQCKFGGVDAVLIAFHENGVVQRTELVDTAKLEQMFPNITSKCTGMVHGVLKWVRNVMREQPEHRLFHLAFRKRVDGRKNGTFELRRLTSDSVQKRVFAMLSGKESGANANVVTHGLVIDAQTHQINV